MQAGSVVRHGRGWRGYWRESGRRRATATFAKKGDARSALNRELDRMELGDAHREPITLQELSVGSSLSMPPRPRRLRTSADASCGPSTRSGKRKRPSCPPKAFSASLSHFARRTAATSSVPSGRSTIGD